MGDGGIMIWRGIGYHGEFEIKFIIRKLNCEICIGTIDEQINAYARIAGKRTFFQSDNAKIVRRYFANK